jgi:putative pyoverdin transport system ATP-binding/permease protein
LDLIRFLLQRSRQRLIAAVAFSLIAGVANVAILAVAGYSISGHQNASVLIVFIAFCAAVPLARVLAETLLTYLVQDSLLTLRAELARRVLAVGLRDFEEIGVHRLSSSFTEDIGRITSTFGLIPVMFMNLGAILASFAYMVWLDPLIFTGILVFIGIGVGSYQWALSHSLKYLVRARSHDDNVYRYFQALVGGFKELKLNGSRREALLSCALIPAAQAARSDYLSGLRAYTYASSWGQLLLFIALGLVIFGFSRLSGTSSQVLVGFSFALLYLIGPLQMVTNAVPELARASVSIRNLERFGLTLDDASEAAAEPPSALVTNSQAPILRTERLYYEYTAPRGESVFTLGPIDISIQRGEIVFITGGNGSGKTTLAKLLTGLYVQKSGKIFLGGQEVTSKTLDSYRQTFAATFSDCYVFDSLFGFSFPDLDLRAQQHLRSLKLDHKLKVRDGKLSTTDLSSGQRKRLALMTALLEDRPILLFDEWAADQDPAFRRLFYEEILPDLRRRGKTSIVITHDDRFFGVADRLLELEGGTVITRSSSGMRTIA